eukprot:GHVS01100097.1.p1 GENE.GHVS01100097.1~~GHVS01100097.1.p1  ORF type:complete len:150 (+),score=25.67 GHVS01100097.1:49-498(+)
MCLLVSWYLDTCTWWSPASSAFSDGLHNDDTDDHDCRRNPSGLFISVARERQRRPTPRLGWCRFTHCALTMVLLCTHCALTVCVENQSGLRARGYRGGRKQQRGELERKGRENVGRKANGGSRAKQPAGGIDGQRRGELCGEWQHRDSR